MIGKSNFVALAHSIHGKLAIKVKQEAAHGSIIDLASSLCLVLTDDLSAVFVDELIFFCTIFHKNAPSIGNKLRMK